MRLRASQFVLVFTALAVFFFTGIEAVAQSTPSRSLLALSKHNHTLAIVDASLSGALIQPGSAA